VKSSSKILLVGAGYLAALGIATVVVWFYAAATQGPDRQAYGGMFAFGDDLLFLGVASLAAIPATGAALFFLRPYPRFWSLSAVTALALAATGVAALVGVLAAQSLGTSSWAMAAPSSPGSRAGPGVLPGRAIGPEPLCSRRVPERRRNRDCRVRVGRSHLVPSSSLVRRVTVL
jgi:hypothetical protein